MKKECKVISFVNQKGGVAKTTSATNVAYILANKYNKKVLLIDFDSQANATQGLGFLEKINEDNNEEGMILLSDIKWSIATLLNNIINNEPLPKKEEYIYNLKGIDLIPSNIDLVIFEKNLINVDFKREYVLNTLINKLKKDYDYIIIDCMPALGLPMINVLFACDEIIIPTHCSIKALSGFNELLKTVNKVKTNGNEKLKIAGVLITMAQENVSAYNYLKNEIENNYSEYYLFKSIIPYVKKFEESDIFSKLWVEHLPTHKASVRYFDFVKEYLSLK